MPTRPRGLCFGRIPRCDIAIMTDSTLPLCTYCRRRTKPMTAASPLALTRDHYPVPKSQGGTRTVPACYQCNHLKGDMSPEAWDAWMAANPQWWEKPEFQRFKAAPFQRKHRNMTPFMRLMEADAQPLPRIPKPKMTAAETIEWLSRAGGSQPPSAAVEAIPPQAGFPPVRHLAAPATVPIAYDDPAQQAAFEAVYRNRLYLLRVPPE